MDRLPTAASEHSSESTSSAPPCLFGRLPHRLDFVQRGLVSHPEHDVQVWIARAIELSFGVLPVHSIRFVLAPQGTPLIGVWIASHDARGRVYPLVLMRRVPDPVRAIPWPLRFAGCESYLDTAESCLMLARTGEIESAWRLVRGLPPPEPRDLIELTLASERALEQESVLTFCRRTSGSAADGGARFARAIRSFMADLPATPGLRAPPRTPNPLESPAATLELRAQDEFDLFAWLELVRSQRPHEATPRAVFWARTERRALVVLNGPCPSVLRRFVQKAPATACTLDAVSVDEAARNASILRERSLAELARALAHGLTALPAEALASMPPPLARPGT